MTRPISIALVVVFLTTFSLLGQAFAEDKTPAIIVVPTDNGSVDVEITFDGGNVTAESVVMDSPQQANVSLKFLDPTTNIPVQNINYDLVVVQEVGSAAKNIIEKRSLYAKDGLDSHLLPLNETGTFLLTVSVRGVGLDEPYDTEYSGTAALTIRVTPEFSVACLAAGLALAGTIFADKFGNFARSIYC